MMEQYRPSLVAYIALAIAWGISIWFAAYLLDQSTLLDFAVENWLVGALIVACIFSPGFVMTWALIKESSIKYTDAGISRLSLLGRKMVYWSEVQEIERSMFLLSLRYGKKKFHIYLLMYKNPENVVNYVFKQVQGLSFVTGK